MRECGVCVHVYVQREGKEGRREREKVTGCKYVSVCVCTRARVRVCVRPCVLCVVIHALL